MVNLKFERFVYRKTKNTQTTKIGHKKSKKVSGTLTRLSIKRDLHKGFFMLDLNEQTNMYYNFLTDLHTHCKVSNFIFFRIWLPLLESKEWQIVKIKKQFCRYRFPKQFLINIQKFEKNSSLQGLNFMPLLACDILVCFLYWIQQNPPGSV